MGFVGDGGLEARENQCLRNTKSQVFFFLSLLIIIHVGAIEKDKLEFTPRYQTHRLKRKTVEPRQTKAIHIKIFSPPIEQCGLVDCIITFVLGPVISCGGNGIDHLSF